jgi:hypothetical protein
MFLQENAFTKPPSSVHHLGNEQQGGGGEVGRTTMKCEVWKPHTKLLITTGQKTPFIDSTISH